MPKVRKPPDNNEEHILELKNDIEVDSEAVEFINQINEEIPEQED